MLLHVYLQQFSTLQRSEVYYFYLQVMQLLSSILINIVSDNNLTEVL